MNPTITLRPPGQPTHYKTPNEHLDYPWDFSDVLDPINDTIDSFTITLETGLDRYATDYSDDKRVVAFISAGGTVGEIKSAVAQIVTEAGRIFERQRWIAIVATR